MAREAESAGPWQGGWRLHGLAVALLAVAGAAGLTLWSKWGLLVAFDAIRTYCF